MDSHEVELVDEDVTLEVPQDTLILEAAERVGLDLPYQCRMGVCGVCCGRRVDGGEVDQTEGMFLSEAEKEEGYVLTVSARRCRICGWRPTRVRRELFGAGSFGSRTPETIQEGLVSH